MDMWSACPFAHHTLTTSSAQQALRHNVRMAQRDAEAGPRFEKMAIPKDAVGRLIGPGGSSIHALQDRTGARIVVAGSGAIQFFAPTAQQAAAVKSSIEALTGTGLQVSLLCRP